MRARSAARDTAVLVFPTPPFWAAMAMVVPLMDRRCDLRNSANWVNALGDSFITVTSGNEKSKGLLALMIFKKGKLLLP